jgi:tetratricopeptide (TPR) repeat protein
LEADLAAILAGAELGTAPGSRADLAEWCCKYRRLPLTSVRLYEDAFAKQKSLADDLDARHRFHAACAAALAASGSEAESAKLDDTAKAALRQKAYAWLRADGLAWMRRHKEGKSGDLPRQAARVWQECKELAGVRDEASLAKLPEEERRNWRNLWAEMKTLMIRNGESYVKQGRLHIDRKEWAEAAACYAQLKHAALTDEPWFEYAAVLLLAGDHDGYLQNCNRMLGDKMMRDFLVARACTLSPKSPLEAVRASEARAGELRSNEKAFWSLTERGALNFRKNRVKEAMELFQKSLMAEPRQGAAVLNWLWLALAHQKLGNTDEARFWLNKAGTWLDSVGKELPANAESFALHRHNWLEAQILRREAESLLAPK